MAKFGEQAAAPASAPEVNPANAPEKSKPERKRIPMSMPTQRLQAPDIPGYHLHWHVSGRVQRAIAGGYEFVSPEEIDVVNTGLADDASKSGNTDLGSRVSVSAGETLDEQGNEQRLYLMKIKQEWWDEDQKALAGLNEQIAANIRGGSVAPAENAYIPSANIKSVANLFTPKRKVSPDG